MNLRSGRIWRRALSAVGVALVVVGLGGPAAMAADTRIVGGKPVAPGTYPFQATLLYNGIPGGDYARQYCGGSLISARSVLTAAHCVDFFFGPDHLDPSLLRVVVGRTVLSSTQGQKRQVTKISIHPKWNPNTGDHDVAVLTLASAVTGIKPVRVVAPGNTNLEKPGVSATVTGWGSVVQQPPSFPNEPKFPDQLRAAQVPIVSTADCKKAYAADGGITATMLCAGKYNRDTCQGDSGGPMFVAKDGWWVQLGVTSSGIGCGAADYPGIYTRLSNASVGNFVRSKTT